MPQHRILDAHWRQYVTANLRGASTDQLADMRDAFYNGAGRMFHALTNVGNGTTHKGLKSELDEFERGRRAPINNRPPGDDDPG